MRLAGLMFITLSAFSQTSLDRVMSELAAVRDFKETAISPDGARVAWAVGLDTKAGLPSRNSAVYMTELRGAAKARRVTAGPGKACMERGLAWSPDSARLAFLSDCAKDGQLELYVAAAAGGAPRKLTSLTGYLAHPRWSPDGKSLAFIGGLMSDEDVTGGEIFVASSGSSGWSVRNATPAIPTSVKSISWPAMGRIVFAETHDGGSGISQLDPASGQVERLWMGDESIGANEQSALSVAADGRNLALIRRSWTAPP